MEVFTTHKLLAFFLVVLFLLPIVTFAQNKKELNGQITARDKDVTGVVVQNISTKKATITDLDGNFSILVSVNDTLIFSAIQFKRKVFPITATIYTSNFITVPLEDFVNELNEVVVRPFNLSGNLGSDITGLKLEKDVSAEALGLPNAGVKVISQSERKLYEATTGGGIPLNPIINAITGRTKKLKNQVKLEAKYARTQRVQNFYVDSVLVRELKIPNEKLDDFMHYCEVDSTFQKTVDTKDKLKILEFMVKKSLLYREDNNFD